MNQNRSLIHLNIVGCDVWELEQALRGKNDPESLSQKLKVLLDQNPHTFGLVVQELYNQFTYNNRDEVDELINDIEELETKLNSYEDEEFVPYKVLSDIKKHQLAYIDPEKGDISVYGDPSKLPSMPAGEDFYEGDLARLDLKDNVITKVGSN